MTTTPKPFETTSTCLACQLLAEDRCDGTLRATRQWAAQHGAARWLVPLLQRHDGYCDCEVLTNAIPELPFVERGLVLHCLLSARELRDPVDDLRWYDVDDEEDEGESLWAP